MEAALLLQRSAIVLFGGCNAAHFGAMWRRMGRQRAVAGEGTPGETAAGERRRGRRIGADVPALTNPDFVLTSGAQVAPTVEPWPAGIAALAVLVPMAAVGAMSFLVLRSRSSRCRHRNPPPTWPSRQRPRRGDPATLPPRGRRASDRRKTITLFPLIEVQNRRRKNRRQSTEGRTIKQPCRRTGRGEPRSRRDRRLSAARRGYAAAPGVF